MTAKPSLQPGDRLRVVSPSRDISVVPAGIRERATRRLAELGLAATVGAPAPELDPTRTAPVAHRVAELHGSFADDEIRGVLSSIGGFHCNAILADLKYDLIERHPKVVCGYSDITALLTAIAVKTDMVTYYGPHFASFGVPERAEFTVDAFRRMTQRDGVFDYRDPGWWSDDRWYEDPVPLHARPGSPRVLVPGAAEGRIVVGNLQTLRLLHGTEYFPVLSSTVLFLEDVRFAEERSFRHFVRQLDSLIHDRSFPDVRALVIGRFQSGAGADADRVAQLVRDRPALRRIPVFADVPFGHTVPQLTIPFGGWAEVEGTTDGQFRLRMRA